MLRIALYVVFFFALGAALTPTEKLWQRIAGGLIVATLLGALFHRFFTIR
jgi:hypothetical protein